MTRETDRLLLVKPQAGHLAAYRHYCASDRSRFVGGPFDAVKAFEKLCSMAGHWTLRGFGRYVITLKTTGQPIGHVGALQIDDVGPPEMTWTLWHDGVEGQGYAYEAAQAYLEHAADATGADHLLIRIEADNIRSQRLADRIGAQRDITAIPPDWMPNGLTYIVQT